MASTALQNNKAWIDMFSTDLNIPISTIQVLSNVPIATATSRRSRAITSMHVADRLAEAFSTLHVLLDKRPIKHLQPTILLDRLISQLGMKIGNSQLHDIHSAGLQLSAL